MSHEAESLEITQEKISLAVLGELTYHNMQHSQAQFLKKWILIHMSFGTPHTGDACCKQKWNKLGQS